MAGISADYFGLEAQEVFLSFLERDSFSSGHQDGLGYNELSVGVEAGVTGRGWVT